MRQSNVIFGTLIFAFIVFITMRGQLPAYLDLFKSKPPEKKSASSGSDFFGNALSYFKKNAAIAAKAMTGM